MYITLTPLKRKRKVYEINLSFLQYYLYILNQKRNFRKIGLRGGHTRYERKKNRHLPQMKLKYQMKLMIFRLYMNFDELIFNHCAITNTNKNC